MDMQKFDLHIVTGNLGSGKTTTSEKIEQRLGVPSVSPNTIRKERGMEYRREDAGMVMWAVWDRVTRALIRGDQITLRTPYVARASREQGYRNIKQLSDHIGRDLQVALIRCECSEQVSKQRMQDRGKEPSHTGAYDRIKKADEPISEAEIAANPNISFLIFNTEESQIQPLSAREQHAVAIDNLVKILLPRG